MSVLGKIREKTGLLLVVICSGIGLFLLQDAITSSTEIFGGNERAIAEIYGESVDYDEYDRELQRASYSFQMQQNRTPNDFENRRLKNDAWNKVFFNKGYSVQFDELGLEVTRQGEESEEVDMVQGETIHKYLKQQFANPETKEFDVKRVQGFLASIANPQNQEQQQAKVQWALYKEDLLQDRLKTKYTDLLSKSNYVTKAEAEKQYLGEKEKNDVEYLFVPYSVLSDSSVVVNDEILNDYIREFSYKYEVKESRSLAYVSFDVAATPEDIAAIEKEVTTLKEKFATAANDTLFVNAKADNPTIPAFKDYASLPVSLTRDSSELVAGTVYGPIREGNFFKLYKVAAINKNDTSYKAEASHILIRKNPQGTPEEQEVAKAKAEGLLTQALGGADFAVLAKEFSEDPGSGEKGGSLGEFAPGAMVPPFNDAVFSAKATGVVAQLVESQFGYHIINVTKTKFIESVQDNYLVAEVNTEILASKKTRDQIYRDANIYLNESTSVEEMRSLAEEKGYRVETAENVNSESYGFGKYYSNGREMVRWSFEAETKVGTVAPQIFDIDNAFVVVGLSSKIEEGDKSLASLRTKIEKEALNHQKSLKIIAELNKQTGDDFQARAAALNKAFSSVAVIADKAPVGLSDGSVGSAGNDPKFIGASAGISEGKESKAIVGQNGVLVVRGEKLYPAPEATDYQTQIDKLLNNVSFRDAALIDNAIKEDAEIVDLRVKFF